jgi:phenylalanyl-tRNA synthetase beta chain
VLLFEVGRVFPTVDLEEERLGALLMGDFSAKTWQASIVGGFYSFKGLLESMAAKLGDELKVVPIEKHVQHKPECLHPGIAGALEYNEQFVGIIGAVHPSVLAALELPSNIVLAEIRLPLPSRAWAFADPSRQPAAIRDLAIIADKTLPYSRLEEITRNAAGTYLESVQPFDVFESERIGQGKRSTAITMTWRAQNRTLTDEEVGGAFQNVIAAMRNAGLEIRDS